MELPTGTITVLLTEVDRPASGWGVTPSVEAEGLRRQEAIVVAAIERHGARSPIERPDGDRVAAAFTRASDAITAAVAAQEALAAEAWPGSLTVRVRMALHTGEVHGLGGGEPDGGPVVIRGARLRALAHGGQVLVSAVTRGLVADTAPVGVSFADLGTHALPGLDRPEHVFRLLHPGLPDDAPEPASIDPMPSRVPPEVTSLIGRDDAVADIVDEMAATRLLTLTGAGGSGKTRLAQRAAADLGPGFPDGVVWLELAALTRGDLVAPALAVAVGAREDPSCAPQDGVVAHLRTRTALVVLDNCEHLLDDTSAVTDALLRSCPDVRILTTSREPLNLPNETVWRVPSLPTRDAVRLFAERAGRARPNFRVTDDSLEVIERICRRLDGMPLAIELAAARSRVLSVHQIADGLDDRFRLLTGGHRTVVQRQRTLAASIDWSYGLLDESEQVLLRRLATFAGSFSLDAAESVTAGDGIDRFAVLDVLERLADKSLLTVLEHSGVARYRMLETIRQYGGERLVEAGEVESTRGRLLEWCSSWLDRLEPELISATQRDRLAEIEAELENVRVALDWADATSDGDGLRRMTGALTFFWMLHGHFHEGARWLDDALAIDDGPRGRGRAQWGRAYLALYAGDFDIAAELALAGLVTAEADDDPQTTGRCLDTLATMQIYMSPGDAKDTALQAIERARSVGDDWCLADSIQVYASTFLLADEHRLAQPLLDEAMAIAERIDNRQLMAWHWTLTASAQIRRGERDEARSSLRRGLGAAEEVGDLGIIADATISLSEILRTDGDLDGAIGLLEACNDRLRLHGAAWALPLVHGVLTICLSIAGRPREAISRLTDHPPADGNNVDGALYCVALATAHAALGRRDIEAIIEPWLPAVDAASVFRFRILLDLTLARVAVAAGDPERAEHLVHGHLDALARLELWPDTLDAVEILAAAAASEGRDAEAARRFGAAAALRASIGLERTPAPPLDLDTIEADLRTRLGDASYPAATHEGASLDRAGLVEYLRRTRGTRDRPTSGWRSLTPTESRVVALVAEGLTNPQIAESLLMSRNTVKTHLSHIFNKLDLANRAELAATATRRAQDG